MKKTYIQYDESNSRAFASRHDGAEQFALYIGVDDVYGEWIAETGGNPMGLNELEDAGAEEMISSINAIINDSTTCWEDLTEGDEEYVRGTLGDWGL